MKKKIEKKTEVNSYEKELTNLKTTSSKVRYLNSIGKSRVEISKILNIRYQHVRNVLITSLKKA